MLRMTLCLIIVVSSSFIGFSYSQKLYRRKATLELFSKHLKNALTQIRYACSSLSLIFDDKFDGFKFNVEDDFCKQWEEMLSYYEKDLEKKDILTLKAFADNLGSTDIDGEISNINMYIEMLDECICEAQSNINSKSKLYRTLGVTLGLMLSILLF